ncbi:PREDICTED: HEAT repeat-containing protein 4, partial [Tinamus guttatus]|uniref:HEAT repeat-containing protein 4 n=1 Tax=Tinamus guttatus TaxID=94827 RepID=UPI00052F1B7F
MKTSTFQSNRRSVAEECGVLAECLQGPAVALQSTDTTQTSQDFSCSEQHQLHYLRKYLRHIAESLSFSKDVLEQRGLSYKEYNFKHLYDPSDIIQKSKNEKPIAVDFKRSARPHPQKQLLFPKKNAGLFPKLRKEDSLWGSKAETLPRRVLPPVPSCRTPGAQASPTKPCDKLSGSLTRRQKKWVSEKNTPGSEMTTQEMEKIGLEKLGRTAPQWTVDQQRPRSDSVPCKPVDGEKQKWNAVRDELSSDGDLKILDNAQGEENDMGIISQTQAEKTPGAVFPTSSSGPPAYYPRALSTDNPANKNVTADDTERTSLNPESSAQRYFISRVGKYTYTPRNAFERELYFGKIRDLFYREALQVECVPPYAGTARIVHQVDEGMKDFFILENHDQYCKHLQQPFPRQPECWGCKPQRRAAQRPKKGAFRWIALPTLTPYFVQSDEESPPTKAKEVQKEFKQPIKEVSWETQVLRATLEQWKDAWDLHPQWRNATREGLRKSLTSVHDISRIKALIACASAAVEQHGWKTNPQKLSERSSDLQAADLHVGISPAAVTESSEKCSVTQEVLAELEPLLSEALRDKNTHVRTASALCHYALGRRSEEAQAVMKDALEHGNSADSWAAAQCLALESTVTVPVVAKLLSQLFEKSDATAEEQACLLLAHLGERTDLMEKLSQLMWEDWNGRVRQAATLALGHMELAKEIHDSLREKLDTGSCQTKVQALSLIRQLHYMTDKLFPGFLQCFSSDFVAVRKEACLTAGALGIKDDQVFQCLCEMMQYDPHWIIKVFAIR